MIRKRMRVSILSVLIGVSLVSMYTDTEQKVTVYAAEIVGVEAGYLSKGIVRGVDIATTQGEVISSLVEEETTVSNETVDEPIGNNEVEKMIKPEFPKLTKLGGVNYGPSGKETYYNMNMNGVITLMRGCGFSEEEYSYWVRDDGVKMFGDYVMVAANLSVHPRGSLVECSLGTAIVCDTGLFAYENPYQLDVAVDW